MMIHGVTVLGVTSFDAACRAARVLGLEPRPFALGTWTELGGEDADLIFSNGRLPVKVDSSMEHGVGFHIEVEGEWVPALDSDRAGVRIKLYREEDLR